MVEGGKGEGLEAGEGESEMKAVKGAGGEEGGKLVEIRRGSVGLLSEGGRAERKKSC